MTKKQKIRELLDYTYLLFPKAHCELFYSKDYELLIAVMLSAQTTDQAVNKATTRLFNRFNSLDSLKNASIDEIENIIHSLGCSFKKAKNIHQISTILIEKYNSKVPNNKKALTELPGVGNKTASVVLMELYNEFELPVDTHIIRITNRLGIVKNNDPDVISEKLKTLIPPNEYKKAHHSLIFFGRYMCKAKKPNCEQCKLKSICNFNS